MASNFAARAATSPELTLFATENDWSRLGLAIQHPVTVYTARINQSTFDDGLAELTIDGGSGTLADVKAGMSVYIGSSAGGKQRGIFRARKVPLSTKLYINQTSAYFENDDYITFVKTFGIWQRDATMTSGIIRMDYDIDQGNYLNSTIIPRVAPMAAVLHLADGIAGVVTFTPPDPTLSACYSGTTIASYLYSAPGAVSTTDMDTDHPSWTYNAAGEYLWSCTITDSSGATFTTYRWVFVDPAPFPFKFKDCGGDFNSGDWSFSFTCYEDAAESDFPDRTLVTLFSKDYYAGARDAVGRLTGYENVWASGWIDGDETTYDSEKGEVNFTAHGPAYWMKKLRASVFALQDTSSIPTDWTHIEDMTVDKALAHLLFWTSTAPMVMDCFFTGDTTPQKIFSTPGGYLWDQIDAIAGKIFADARVNSYGQMYVEIDDQLISNADRASVPVVMDITKHLRKDGLNIDRTSDKVAMIELAAAYYDGTNVFKIYSRAPGNVAGIFGGIDPYDDYMIVDQDECNRLAGCLLAMRNNDYEPIEIVFPATIRLFDICPRMAATITVAAADNPRGVALTAARLIPRAVKYIEEQAGIYSTQVTFEVETIGVDGVTYVPPVIVDAGIPNYEIPDGYGFDGGDLDFPMPSLDFPEFIPDVNFPANCTPLTVDGFTAKWDIPEVRGEDSTKLIAKCYFPCTIHGAANPIDYVPTQLVVNGFFGGDASTNYTVYAVKDGARVLTGTQDGTVKAWWTFASTTPVVVDGFELELNAGTGSSVTYTPLDVIGSDSALGLNNQEKTISGLVVDQYYSLEAVAGQFYAWPVGHPNYQPIYYFMARDSARASGYVGYYTLGNVMYLQTGSIGIYAEAIDNHYARIYFKATETNIIFKTSDDSNPTDNSGSITVALRNARVDARRILLTSLGINNVCE